MYDTEGKLVAEYANQLSPTPQVSYLTTDALGSPRIKTDANGNVISRNDYLPFGEDLYTAQRTLGVGYKPDDIRRKFTTYKRDAETELDFAEARYYSSKWGRFVSPDEFTGGPDELFDFADDASNNPTFYADLTNPQSLNKYQYTYNNPLNLTDPTGHCPPLIAGAIAAICYILANPTPLGPRQPQATGEVIGDVLGILPGGRGAGGVIGGILTKVLKGVGGKAVIKGGQAVVNEGVKQTVKQTSKKAISKTQKQVKKEARGGRNRIKTGQDAQDQLESIQKAQDNLRKGKGKGKTIIDSTKKSQQRVDNKNKKIKNLKDALDEYGNK